nr:hypothetical protein [Elizabethkingia sp. ASV34]
MFHKLWMPFVFFLKYHSAFSSDFQIQLLHPVSYTHLTLPVSYTHLTLPTTVALCRYRWSTYH